MAVDYDIFFERLLDGYRSNYDIEKVTDGPMGLVAKAHMHVEESQCLLFEEFKMWSADSDEYVYFFHVPHLSDQICEECIQYAYDDGFPKIKLDHLSFHKQHMCTRLVVLFLCEEAEEEAVKRVKKCRIYKSFQFSLKGWMEMHTAVVDLGKGSVESNRYGKDTAKFLKKLLIHIQNLEK